MTVRVLRVSHGARDPQFRGRDRALVAAGVDLTLVVPSEWAELSSPSGSVEECFPVVELPVRRSGDMNRHRYRDRDTIRRLLQEVSPDVLDLHAEPFSAVGNQWLECVTENTPVVMYTAQNIDKRYPPPFARYERSALKRISGFYPCSRQAAAVIRGKGFGGAVEVLPLGYHESLFHSGSQTLDDAEIVLMLVGRLVPEKGVVDAVSVLERVSSVRPARLVVIGSGPDAARARELAEAAGLHDRLEILPWQSGPELAAAYRRAHVVLVPSRATERWVEQFGRVIVEAQASGAVVAAYASGAIPEAGGNAAMLAPAGDLDGLVSNVLRVLEWPSEFSARRETGLRQAAEQTWGRVAERQAALYERVRSPSFRRMELARSPRRRRRLARQEFGPTAPALGGVRPFALPILRRGGTIPRALGRCIDAMAELAASVPTRRPDN